MRTAGKKRSLKLPHVCGGRFVKGRGASGLSADPKAYKRGARAAGAGRWFNKKCYMPKERCRHVVIMAKEPRMGRVKTRLARDIGYVVATSFYRRMIAKTVRKTAADKRWQTHLSATPDDWGPGVALSEGVSLRPQGFGDLGDRMLRIFLSMPPGPVLIIGTDIPDIGSDVIADAFRKLGNSDAVFGPATDGGFWMIGLRRTRRPSKKLFHQVRWSTPHALSDTLRNLDKVSVSYAAELNDIDRGEDYAGYMQEES